MKTPHALRKDVHQALAWLLDPSDPGVQARALLDLLGRDPDDPEVVAARQASRTRGSVARLLEGLVLPEDPNGLYVPKYGAAFHRLVALAETGAPPGDARVQRALDACLGFLHKPDGGFGRSGGHLCVTGNLVRAATRLGRGDDPRVARALDWLVARQEKDGGWHCFPDGTGTLDAWEPLAAFAALPPKRRPADVVARGLEFLLDAFLGVDEAYAPWQRIHFPRHYYYDVLVGLELATELGDPRDERLQPALAWLRSKRGPDGLWRLDAQHPDLEGSNYTPHHPHVPLTVSPLVVEPTGAPSRWATLAALRVLARVDSAAGRAREPQEGAT